jgi:hypothetical protein
MRRGSKTPRLVLKNQVLPCLTNFRSSPSVDHGGYTLSSDLSTHSDHFARPSRDGQPVRQYGPPFFDDLVRPYHDPQRVRRGLFTLLEEQYREAGRIRDVRGWGGAQPPGNDRYQFSRHQDSRIKQLIPGAHIALIRNAVTIQLGPVTLYPIHSGATAAQCPTSVKVKSNDKGVWSKFATGALPRRPHPTLFDESPPQKPEMVWVIFTGNHVDGGPLSSYVAKSKGYLADGRLALEAIEPLLKNDDDGLPYDHDSRVPVPSTVQTKEPAISLSLRS